MEKKVYESVKWELIVQTKTKTGKFLQRIKLPNGRWITNNFKTY